MLRLICAKSLFLKTALCAGVLSTTSLAEPLAHFPFNEGSGDQTTDTVRGLVGILGVPGDPSTQPVWTNDTPTGAAGDFALAFNLNDPPVRPAVTVDAAETPFDFGANNTNYTLQAWVKLPTRLPTDRMVIYRTTGPGPRVSLSINHNRTLHTTVYGNADFASSVVVPNDNRWHHVAAVMENDFGRVRFYLDGISRQTINRTATGVPSSSGSGGLTIGMESENRYFTGLLDRVRLDNTALEAGELDYPAVPGMATFAALEDHPTPSESVVDIGATVTLEARPTATDARIFWRHRALQSGPVVRELADAAMAVPRLILTNVTLADRGFYSLVVSNQAGVTESYGARVEVSTAPGTLQPLWSIQPGEREYVTGYSSSATTRDLERGMAYNPVTDHLLIGSRINSPTIRGIYIIDAGTGEHVGELQGSSAVTGGTIVLTRVGVADDGAIYASNFGTLTDTNPLKIYRWASETAPAPTIAYEGNPVSGITGNQQWGKNMIVRGAGVNTQILMDTRTKYLALFTTADGENFTPNILLSDAYDDATLGLAWGEGNSYWGKAANEALYQWDLDLTALSATMRTNYLEFPGNSFMNFGFSEDREYMAGLNVQAGPDAVELYSMTNAASGPVLLDAAHFTADNTHSVGYGNVIISSNRVFALNPNNGIAAFRIGTPSTENPSLTISGDENIVISWPATFEGFVLEATTDLVGGTWSTVAHQTVGGQNTVTVEADQPRRFFRLRRA